MTPEQKEMADKFINAKSDKGRWKLIKDSQHLGIVVFLDNDDTFACFVDDDDSEPLRFDGYVGRSYGVVSLLEAIEIKSESV